MRRTIGFKPLPGGKIPSEKDVPEDTSSSESIFLRKHKGAEKLMLKYLGKRIARSFLTLIIILTAVFCLLRPDSHEEGL